ncbi:MAG: hypothetical protein AVDCRST_MAG28-1692 [uncultured Rubrobacteraceae bacterium]|uniref:Uncharacterized protein n=1 Tax=uncultured Rubrobacteraceae bacterium TaxID=349277 RepID=A0A6J4Q575_9ACTN|nr:MAG: hypothetical protein AVDCRST_MAG28-1692 [uncultured Rubrobacteraceae bacterium]
MLVQAPPIQATSAASVTPAANARSSISTINIAVAHQILFPSRTETRGSPSLIGNLAI